MAIQTPLMDASTYLATKDNLGTKELVLWLDADRVLTSLMLRLAVEYESKLGAVNTYRSWLLWKNSQRWLKLFHAEARVRLIQLLYRQNKTVGGIRRIKRSGKPFTISAQGGSVTVGETCGQLAHHNKRGRPRMNPSVRLERKRARDKRRYDKVRKGLWRWKHHAPAPVRKPHRAFENRPNPNQPKKTGADKFKEKLAREGVKALTDAVKDELKDALHDAGKAILKRIEGQTLQDPESLYDFALVPAGA